jgi:hypothetical protein
MLQVDIATATRSRMNFIIEEIYDEMTMQEQIISQPKKATVNILRD